MTDPLRAALDNEVAAGVIRTDVARGVIALALYRAGIQGSGKDGLPWLVAEGVQMAMALGLENAAKVQTKRLTSRSTPDPLRAKAQEVVSGHTNLTGVCRECNQLWPCHAWLLADEILRRPAPAETRP